MNKAELISAVSKAAKLTKKDAMMAVEATLDAIRKNTKKGVQLVGFGSFAVAKRKGRMGRNPRTGEEIKIPPSKTVRFRPGSAYKEQL